MGTAQLLLLAFETNVAIILLPQLCFDAMKEMRERGGKGKEG